jgi:O-antigen biosynthesis protein WbqP
MHELYKRFIKRILDILISGVSIIVLLPVFLLLSIWIKVDTPGPVLFTQKRIGKGNRNFQILKFRTMRTDTPENVPTHMLNNPEVYITRCGRFLRKTSLDELPQLFNILIGQMSLVGPRPALWNQDDLIAERDRYGANDIEPGLTGWAQINGRDVLKITDKARYDGEYVKRMSLRFDWMCFWVTVSSVIKFDGVAEGCTHQSDTEVEQNMMIGNKQ